MRAITDEEIESALRGGAQRVKFFPGEQARIPGGQVTFIGSIVDAVIRITAGLGPRDYGNVLDVATYNKVGFRPQVCKIQQLALVAVVGRR